MCCVDDSIIYCVDILLCQWPTVFPTPIHYVLRACLRDLIDIDCPSPGDGGMYCWCPVGDMPPVCHGVGGRDFTYVTRCPTYSQYPTPHSAHTPTTDTHYYIVTILHICPGYTLEMFVSAYNGLYGEHLM